MDYAIRQAEESDLETILSLYASARVFMAHHGNATQWCSHHPSMEKVQLDIQNKDLYVLIRQDTIHGVFAMITGDDPTYQRIYDGAWHYDLPYAAIHRVAGDGSGGIMAALTRYTLSKHKYIRIDTHENNTPMRRAIQRTGFSYCGIIITDDGSPRLAYDLKK